MTDIHPFKKEKFLTFQDLKREYDFSETWVRRAMKFWGFPSYKLGGARKFLRSDVERWIRERKETSA